MPDPAPPTDAELDAMLERANSSSVGLGESLRDVLQREDAEFVAAAGDDILRLVAEVRRLRDACAEATGKWRLYENEYILPLFGLAEKDGIDLRRLVSENAGKNCSVLLAEHLLAEVRRLRRGEFSDAELRALARALPEEGWRRLDAERHDFDAKRLGYKPPADEAERAELKALYAGQTEPCCECGEEYPRGELVIDGEIYCAKCRAKET